MCNESKEYNLNTGHSYQRGMGMTRTKNGPTTTTASYTNVSITPYTNIKFTISVKSLFRLIHFDD